MKDRENSGHISKWLIQSLSPELPLRQTEQNEKTELDNGEVKESRGQLRRERFWQRETTEKMNSMFFL